MMIIDDAKLIDQVNPFLIEPPGTWSRPYDFSDKENDVTEVSEWGPEEQSPGCMSSATGSDNQIAWCEPRTPNCPMRRMLEPTQKAESDVTYPGDPGNVPISAPPPEEVSDKSKWYMYILLIVLLIAAGITIIVKF